jgi:hypothetical protein
MDSFVANTFRFWAVKKMLKLLKQYLWRFGMNTLFLPVDKEKLVDIMCETEQ